MVQWLRLLASTAGGVDSILGRGTKILNAAALPREKKKVFNRGTVYKGLVKEHGNHLGWCSNSKEEHEDGEAVWKEWVI